MNDLLSPAASGSRLLQRAQSTKFGPELTGSGCRFRLWAPGCARVALALGGSTRPIAMDALPRGWFECEVAGAGPGTRYEFILPDGRSVPDPASRYQPLDVEGPSEVVDPRAYFWHDLGWRGRPWEETVGYELHVGTFTPQGTFRAAIERLDHLARLGVTAIELMPIADFPGRWNWGYDGAFPYAPDASYGRPEDLKALIDAAHQRSLMVFLDVVYNHFGPKGNYMPHYAPVHTGRHQTPWGPAINFDDDGSEMIRDYFIANARYWLNEFNVDGLRFDAVHEIQDTGPRHMLQQMVEELRAATDGRHIHLIAENSDNQAGWLKRRRDLTPGLFTAQWSDDIHHTLHCAVTGEKQWYYADFAGRLDLVGRALAEGLAYQGERTPSNGKRKGEPSQWLPATAFVSFIQNHDQAGNRPRGERLSRLVAPETARALAAIYLLAPEIPLLFMGEEWGSSQPFLFFSDVGSDLADAIRTSRRGELSGFPEIASGEEVPDPMAEWSFLASKLDWQEVARSDCAQRLQLYRTLIALRQEAIVPRLHGMAGNSSSYRVLAEQGVAVRWRLGEGSELRLAANLSERPLPGVECDGRCLWLEGDLKAETLGPWGVLWSLVPPQGGAD